jgi:tetratricopeptide (TPR) repeat protein
VLSCLVARCGVVSLVAQYAAADRCLISAAQIGSQLGEAQKVAAAIAEAEALIGPHAPPRQAAALALANAVNHLYLGQHEQAVEGALRQAAIYRDSGNEWGVHLALANAALYECGLGRFDSAIVRLRTALDTLRRINAPYGVGNALQFLAFAHALRGDRNEALANGRASIPYLQSMGDPSGVLLAIALLHARHGAEDRAASLLGYVDRAFARTGRIVFPMLQRIREELMERVQAALEPVAFDRQTAAGAALTQEQALALAFDDAPGTGSNKAPQ